MSEQKVFSNRSNTPDNAAATQEPSFGPADELAQLAELGWPGEDYRERLPNGTRIDTREYTKRCAGGCKVTVVNQQTGQVVRVYRTGIDPLDQPTIRWTAP